MSNEQKMVSTPPYIGLEPLVGRYYPAKCRRCGWVGSSEELTEDDAQCTRDVGDRLCLGDCDELDSHDLLGIIQAMAQPYGEPVARHPDAIIEGVMTQVGITHAIYASTVTLKHGERVKLYAHPQAPVAVALPERLPGDDGVCTESHYASGWNACLDEVTRLNAKSR